MKIETFEEATFTEDPSSLVVEGEMLSLYDELGLDGQKELTVRKDGQTATSICPYRLMTKREMTVFKLVLPKITELKSYRDSVIPLRILQVAKHAQEFFPRIEVWHPEPGKPDPLLVGRSTTNIYSGELSILARWGETLMPFEQMAKEAARILRSKLKSELVEAEQKLQLFKAKLNTTDVDIEDLPSSISVYGS